MAEVKLLGNWASRYSRRVELALKIKGVKYEYIEEDLEHKSPLLLQCNPVHKQVPVLIHKDTVICESLVIIEYIDETWKHHRHILPKEPCLRAEVRFWAKFIDDKMAGTVKRIGFEIKEETKKIIEEVHEHLEHLEHKLKHEEHEFFEGIELGYLDIVAFSSAYWLKLRQEIQGVELITAAKHPCLLKWLEKLHKIDVVQECVPPREKHIACIKARISAKLSSK